MMTQRFRKLDNNLMNLWEIGLFHIVRRFEVFLKVPMIIIIIVGENNVLGRIYIYIYRFWRWARRGDYMVHLIFFCLLFIKTEKVQERELY